jgi:guanylate kinase
MTTQIPPIKGRLFVVSAPSGAGKTSLVNALLAESKPEHRLARVITYTTKPPRPGEVHGRDYNFVSAAEFNQKIAENFFLEWSSAYGNLYGSPRSVLDEIAQGQSRIIIVDRDGVYALRSIVPRAVYIWVTVATIDILEQRLHQRNTEEKEQQEYRIRLAGREMAAHEQELEMFTHNIINTDFSQALQELKTIVIQELESSNLDNRQ